VRLFIAVHNDIGHGGQLAGLNLEVAYRKAVLGITFEKHIRAVVRKQLLGRDGAFKSRRRQLSSSLDDGNASDTLGNPANTLPSGSEEGELDLVLGVEAM
jgi:hypothetical protein